MRVATWPTEEIFLVNWVLPVACFRIRPDRSCGRDSHHDGIELKITHCDLASPGKLMVTAADYLPDKRTLPALADAAEACKGCDLYQRATQTVFGEGQAVAEVVMVGEQPGDQEDRQGHPFVGPAGGLLDAAMEEAGLSRQSVYLTNAVKHFKWEPRGKRRLHKKPGAREMAACRPWLVAELEVIQPQVIVCLGATAAQSLLGRAFRITRQRGQLQNWDGHAPVLPTWHPASILRAPDADSRDRKREELVRDLQQAAEFVTSR